MQQGLHQTNTYPYGTCIIISSDFLACFYVHELVLHSYGFGMDLSVLTRRNTGNIRDQSKYKEKNKQCVHGLTILQMLRN